MLKKLLEYSMNQQSIKLIFIGSLFLSIALISCDCGNKPIERISPKSQQKEQPTDEKQDDSKPKKIGNKPSGAQSEVKGPEEITYEFEEDFKEIENMDPELNVFSKDEKEQIEDLKNIAYFIKAIKKHRIEIQKYQHFTSKTEKKYLERAYEDLELRKKGLQNIFKLLSRNNKIKEEVKAAKGQNEESSNHPEKQQQSGEEILHNLEKNVVKLFFKHASEVVPIDINILINATKLTSVEIEALKHSK
jgi:hypothetical protein